MVKVSQIKVHTLLSFLEKLYIFLYSPVEMNLISDVSPSGTAIMFYFFVVEGGSFWRAEATLMVICVSEQASVPYCCHLSWIMKRSKPRRTIKVELRHFSLKVPSQASLALIPQAVFVILLTVRRGWQKFCTVAIRREIWPCQVYHFTLGHLNWTLLCEVYLFSVP